MTGHVRENVIGRSVYEVDVLENAERKELAIERLIEGATIPQMQAELRLPEGGTKLVIVAGQPLDMHEEDCMLFSFTDLEPRRKAENALRQSEERFAKAFRLSPVPTLLCSADRQQLIDANEAFLDTLGYTAQELLGKTVAEIDFMVDRRVTSQIFDVLEKTGRIDGLDLKLRKKATSDSTVSCKPTASAYRTLPAICWF